MDITIILPVFNAFELTGACLEALNKTAKNCPVMVIDDASTDTRIAPLLSQFCDGKAHRWFYRNPENLGFVKTVNLGMSRCAGDVILLNSDTEVTDGWVEALYRCLESDPEIATATPWTNNGEIVSFPKFCVNNPPPADPERMALAARDSKLPGYPELPTAVGFCMAISRRSLAALGNFDAETFGVGYGEENDFSMRARAAGLRNVLCDDAYVVHHGGASFGPLGLRPNADSMSRLTKKHPGYPDLVSRFIREDPLAARRAALAHALDQQVP